MKKIIISTDEAKQDKLFYIVSNVIIVRRESLEFLILKRSKREKVHPGKWSFPGGKLEHADVKAFLQESGKDPIVGVDNILGRLAAREAKEECGLTISAENTKVTNPKVFIRPDGIPVFIAILSAEYEGGDVVLEEGAISDFAWTDLEGLSEYDHIEGMYEEAEAAVALFV